MPVPSTSAQYQCPVPLPVVVLDTEISVVQFLLFLLRCTVRIPSLFIRQTITVSSFFLLILSHLFPSFCSSVFEQKEATNREKNRQRVGRDDRHDVSLSNYQRKSLNIVQHHRRANKKREGKDRSHGTNSPASEINATPSIGRQSKAASALQRHWRPWSK